MGTILLHVLACCLLVISLAATQNTDSTTTPAMPAGLSTTKSTTYETSENASVHTTTVQPQTPNSTSMSTPLTSSTSPTTATSGTDTPTFTATSQITVTATSQTTVTATSKTTAVLISTPDTTVITTANVSHTTNTTSDSEDRVTHGYGFNNSEKNITIVLSVTLGVFAVAFVIFMFNRCKHNVQYMHQPFTNSDDPDALEAGDDTLVISGGLYDGHPIYDNVPPAHEDQSQFRLEFIH